MKIKVMHHGHIDELVQNSSEFAKLKCYMPKECNNRMWSRQNLKSSSYDMQAIVIGKTGYGKSTTLNAIFGKNIMVSSDIDACTRDVQSFEFKIRQNHYFSIADFPGIGESITRDTEYLKLYKQILYKTDVVIYILRADMRDFSIDLQAINYLFSAYPAYKKNILYVMNFADKIEPISRNNFNTPSTEQIANINKKLEELKDILKPSTPIIPYSASTGWNLDVLKSGIVNKLISSDYIKKTN